MKYSSQIPNSELAREIRLQEIARLKYLEKAGLAKQIDRKPWELNKELKKSLLAMKLSSDILEAHERHGIKSLLRIMPVLTHLSAKQPLTGKVVGIGLEDELHDLRYILLECTDDKVHYIRASQSIVAARDKNAFSVGNIITLEK